MAKGVKLSAKIALDVVMFLILVLLYKAKVLTLTYHEVAGIGILLVFLVHCLFNRRWIANNAKKLFSPQTPARTKFSYWLSVALIICFLIIVISGVFISKVLFKEQIAALNMDTSIFRTLHMFFSAISLILVGIHLGLYWGMVKGFFRKKIKMPEAVAKPICYVLLAAVVAFGAYSVPTTSFSQWLLCPVIPIEHGHGGKSGKATEAGDSGASEREHGEETASAEHAESDDGGNAKAGESSAAETVSDTGEERSSRYSEAATATATDATSDGEVARGSHEAEADEAAGNAEAADSAETDGHAGKAADANDSGNASDHADNATSGNAQKEKSGQSGNHGNNVELSNVLLTIAQFGSIAGLFAAITYYLNEALRRRKKATK